MRSPGDTHAPAGGEEIFRRNLTPAQKMHALAYRFYQDGAWAVARGDYYTTSRADLELYQVVDVQDGKVFTRYCDPAHGGEVTEWDFDGFTTKGFGPKRVYVPEFVFGIVGPPAAYLDAKAAEDAAVKASVDRAWDRFSAGIKAAEALSTPAPNGPAREEVARGNRIWFDTEFLENGRTIELLSIGLVREDGATYYAETPGSDEIALGDDWLRANVWPHLLGPNAQKPRHRIAREIVAFVGEKPEFWAYYADYDWVALCQLYGRMIDLPEGWPMFCRDLKQIAGDTKLPKQEEAEHHALADALWTREAHLALPSIAQARAEETDATLRGEVADMLSDCWREKDVGIQGTMRYLDANAVSKIIAALRGEVERLASELKAAHAVRDMAAMSGGFWARKARNAEAERDAARRERDRADLAFAKVTDERDEMLAKWGDYPEISGRLHDREKAREAEQKACREALAERDRLSEQVKALAADVSGCPFDGPDCPDIAETEPCPVCGMLGTMDAEVKCPFPVASRSAIRSSIPAGGEEKQGASLAGPGVIAEIAAERRRQVEVEGWTPEHDDEHRAGELARAAGCYAIGADHRREPPARRTSMGRQSYWPWDAAWWKPKRRRHDLIRAAALIVAELERMDRQAQTPSLPPQEATHAEG